MGNCQGERHGKALGERTIKGRQLEAAIHTLQAHAVELRNLEQELRVRNERDSVATAAAEQKARRVGAHTFDIATPADTAPVLVEIVPQVVEIIDSQAREIEGLRMTLQVASERADTEKARADSTEKLLNIERESRPGRIHRFIERVDGPVLFVLGMLVGAVVANAQP